MLRIWVTNHGLPTVLLAVALLALPRTDARTAEPVVELEVTAGEHPRYDAVVQFTLPDSLRAINVLQLTSGDKNTPVVTQRTADGAKLVWLMRGEFPAGARRTFKLTEQLTIPKYDEAGVSISGDDGRLAIRVAGKPVLDYHTAVAEPPKPLEGAYRRSGFLHPLYTPDGRVLTDDFPPDHAHQHGVFFAWVNTLLGDRPIDFWNQLKGVGTIEHVSVDRVQSGPVFGEFRVKLRHLDLTTPEAPRAALTETWTVRVYNVADPYFIDLESRQRCAGDETLAINKYHYGGLALRGARAWFDEQAKGVVAPSAANAHSDFLTSDGHGRASGNHTRPRWVDMFGEVDGRPCGVAVLGHPQNFRYPQAVRLHPTKPYFCFSPMVDESFSIAPGDEYVSRYRFICHNDAPDSKRIDNWQRDYAEPLEAQVLK